MGRCLFSFLLFLPRVSSGMRLSLWHEDATIAKGLCVQRLPLCPLREGCRDC